jgi:hypothetical protein
MLEFGDSIYYLDLKAFDKAITLSEYAKSKTPTEKELKQTLNEEGKVVVTEIYERTSQASKEVDGTKYELLKTLIEYIIDYTDESDDTLGADRALQSMPLGFKIVFNTLLKEGIIKEK